MENLIVEGRCRASGEVVAVDLSCADAIKGVAFCGVNLSGQNLDGLYFDECSFEGCRFLKTKMEARLHCCSFEGCEFDMADVGNSMISCRFIRCSFIHSRVLGCVLSTTFKSCGFYKADIDVDWCLSTLEDCNLASAVIRRTDSLTIKDCIDTELATMCLNLSNNAIPDADDNLISFLAEIVVRMAHKSTDANAKRWLAPELVNLVALRKPKIKNQLGLR